MQVPNQYRVRTGRYATDETYGNNGTFNIPRGISGKYLTVVASDGEEYDHVSVSLPSRTPTWEEMCEVKKLFWGEDETVIQYHPPKSEYINNHQYCLHLWKPQKYEIILPLSILVGLK